MNNCIQYNTYRTPLSNSDKKKTEIVICTKKLARNHASFKYTVSYIKSKIAASPRTVQTNNYTC